MRALSRPLALYLRSVALLWIDLRGNLGRGDDCGGAGVGMRMYKGGGDPALV